MKKLLRVAALMAGASLFTVVLGGCTEPDPQRVDQCMRREIFQQCMKALPVGPKTTMYNDWDEVVKECENVAYYQSLRRRSQIKSECLS